VDVTSHGREAVFDDVDLSRTVGWFVSAFPFLLELPEGPARALAAVRDRRKETPQHGFHYGLLRYLSERDEVSAPLRAIPASELIFNYLGQFDQLVAESPLFRLLDESRGNIHHPKGVRRYLLLVNGLVLGGRLTLNLTYSENLYRRATIEGLARSILDALRALAACGSSPEAPLLREPIETFITVGES
jgi:non-ribosomal peptide synthase protein (TIGR01720 family)